MTQRTKAEGMLIESAVRLAEVHDDQGVMTPQAHLLLAHLLDLARTVDGKESGPGTHPYDRALNRVRSGQATVTDINTLELAVAAARGELSA